MFEAFTDQELGEYQRQIVLEFVQAPPFDNPNAYFETCQALVQLSLEALA